MRFISTVTLLNMLIFIQPVHAQQYYKWVDSNGVTNYSAHPPASNIKKKKISTVSTYADGSRNQQPRQQFQSNAIIADTHHQYYSNNATQQYVAPNTSQSSESNEALRQKIIQEASTPYKGTGGRLTAKQQRTLAAVNGGVDSGGYSNSTNPSTPAMPQRSSSTITNCDSSGCWGSDGTRYNRGGGNTYFPSTGGVCQNIGGQMKCN